MPSNAVAVLLRSGRPCKDAVEVPHARNRLQPAILITVDGQPHDEFARQLAYDEDGGVLLDGNGDIVRER
jgi:hypothetical protein